jgi:hypothetical protein
MRQQLAIRVDAANPDHHPWNNHGTRWIHYTLHLDGVRIPRVRISLATGDHPSLSSDSPWNVRP